MSVGVTFEQMFKNVIDYLVFYVPLKDILLFGDVTGLQNLGLCSTLRAFEQGGTSLSLSRQGGVSGKYYLPFPTLELIVSYSLPGS